MRKLCAVAVMLCAVMLAGTAHDGLAETIATPAGHSLPASLDKLFPPSSPAPLLLLAMHEMNQTLSGTVCDLFENDGENARTNMARFRDAYIRASELVPEWEGRFPVAPVDDLEAAVRTGDPGSVMPVMDKLDAVCHSCHVAFMAAVQQKYHWDSFASLSVTDPATEAQLAYKQFKLMMNTDMAGIGNDLAQGQIENARHHADAFSQKFATLKEICTACHDSGRTYYVSDDVTGMIETLRAALDAEQPDAAKVGQLLQGIGQESCFKCHLVHIPSALSQH